MSAVAVVGVGAIGLPMAVTLARAGHDVTAVDPSPERRALAAEQGLATADTPTGDLVIVMVATPAQLAVAVDAAVDGAALWVVTATVGPDAVRTARDRLRPRGIDLLDAPVTGGVAGARRGGLTVFAAGADALLARAEPVLASLGAVHHVGTEVGTGQSVKLVNQLLAGVHLAAAAEALTLAEGLGLDPARVLELVGAGAGSSWMLRDRGPRMLAGPGGDVEVQSAIEIFVKDTGLVTAAGADVGLDLPVARAARDRFARAATLGLGRDDDSQVIRTYTREGA